MVNLGSTVKTVPLPLLQPSFPSLSPQFHLKVLVTYHHTYWIFLDRPFWCRHKQEAMKTGGQGGGNSPAPHHRLPSLCNPPLCPLQLLLSWSIPQNSLLPQMYPSPTWPNRDALLPLWHRTSTPSSWTALSHQTQFTLFLSFSFQ